MVKKKEWLRKAYQLRSLQLTKFASGSTIAPFFWLMHAESEWIQDNISREIQYNCCAGNETRKTLTWIYLV